MKAAILEFDFNHDDFEELGRGYIADSEFRSTKQKTTLALGLKNCWTSDFYFKFLSGAVALHVLSQC